MYESQTIGVDTIVSRGEGLVASEMAGETVMMSIEKGEYYALDPVASRIWRLIEKPCSVAAVCDVLLQHYDGERGEVERDVLLFLNDLMTRGLLGLAA
jgi:hypothetical protein